MIKGELSLVTEGLNQRLLLKGEVLPKIKSYTEQERVGDVDLRSDLSGVPSKNARKPRRAARFL